MYNLSELMLEFKTSNNSRFLIGSLTIYVLILLILQSNSQFCSSTCVDYYGACYGVTSDYCYACAPSIYNLHVDGSVTPWQCTVLPQTSILWN